MGRDAGFDHVLVGGFIVQTISLSPGESVTVTARVVASEGLPLAIEFRLPMLNQGKPWLFTT